MANALIEKMRRARERAVTVDGHTFTIRRPTDGDMVSMKDATGLDLVKAFVVGWDLKEIDAVPGGSDSALSFDPEVWAEWIADRAAMWTPIADAIFDDYTKHAKISEEAAKN